MRPAHSPSVCVVLLAGLVACSDGAGHEPLDAAVGPAGEAGNDGQLDLHDAGVDAQVVARQLSEMGLYADTTMTTLAASVQPFEPQGVLWSDGAEKQRWVELPNNAQIQSADMDAWQLPVGTKLWKQFSLAGKRLETRLLQKRGPEDWTMVAFQWNAQQTDAVEVPDGVEDVAGTSHDIPSSKDCKRCHEGVADVAIGFSAIELAHEGPGVTLKTLAEQGRLSHPPSSTLALPGSEPERAALLYLHANCGNCHNDRTFISNVTDVDYALKSNQLSSVLETNARRTILRDLRKAGSVAMTDVIRRMRFRGVQGQMPPIASEQADTDGLAVVQTWVESLQAMTDGGVAHDASTGD